MSLDDLRRARAAAADKMNEISGQLVELEGAEVPDQSAIDEASAAFEAAEADFKKLDAQVKRGESAESAAAAAAMPVDNGGAARVPAQPVSEAEKGADFGMIAHALVASGGNQGGAAAKLERDGHSGLAATVSGITDAAGGLLIPRPMANSVIDLLRPRVVARKAGARTIPMPAGEHRAARLANSAQASYGASEISAIDASAQEFDSVDQSFKKLRALAPISNSLMRHATNIQVGMMVRDDVIKVMGLREDLAFLRGDGTANTPKGMRNWALAENWIADVAATAAAAEVAILKLVSLVEDADVPMLAGGWVMRSSAKNWLGSLRDAAGHKLFQTVEKGELVGYPIYTTSQMPNNLGAGGDETEIMFADFSEMLIGDAMEIRLAQSSEAAYVDAGGNTRSAFAEDCTLLRAISEHDFAPAHDAAISGLNGVGWSL